MGHKICPITGEKYEYETKLEFNKIELAWSAGFFDGEGCTCLYLNNKRNLYYISIYLPQVNLDNLKRFKKAIGFGRIDLSTDRTRINKYQLNTFEEIQACMCMLWPYLGKEKKEQYKRCITGYIRDRRPLLPNYGRWAERLKAKNIA